MKKYSCFIIALLLPITTLFSLEKEDFLELAHNAREWIKENRSSVEIEENESAFLRIRIPVQGEKYADLDKVRLNFWKNSNPIAPETIHSHPQYFESYILVGEYQHEIFRESADSGELMQSFLISKKGDASTRIAAKEGQVHVVSLGLETVKKGEIYRMPTDLLHRIVSTSNTALSINAVYNSHKETTFIKTYRGVRFPFPNIDTKRKTLSKEEAEPVIEEILQLLEEL